MTPPGIHADPPPVDLHEQLSTLQGLLVLSSLMTESGDEHSIVDLAATAMPSLGPCRLVAVYGGPTGWCEFAAGTSEETRRQLISQLERLGNIGGWVTAPGQGWSWAFPIRSLEGHLGHLVAGADAAPSDTEQFLLRVLAQQMGMALANAALLSRLFRRAEDLRSANDTLAETVSALERSASIHARLTHAAVSGQGMVGIARVVHELTGYPIAVEDVHGNLIAWAGPGRSETYRKASAPSRERLLRRAMREGHPVREGERLVRLARSGMDVLGAIVLVDPSGKAGLRERVALEHGATVLTVELARLRSLGEAELRLRRDLLEELLVGTDDVSALGRAEALGYDLQRPHRVVVVEGSTPLDDRALFFHAVRRAARDTDVGSLLVERNGFVVVLSSAPDGPRPGGAWERLRLAVLGGLGRGGACRIGIGELCLLPSDFPNSYRTAQFALMLQRTCSGSDDRAVAFEHLGVYRLFAKAEDSQRLDRLVREWLGPLLDYDEQKGSALVLTLSRYLECGGAYDRTASELMVHRSTLKYRLQRIREISGRDLGDPDTRFHLQLATRAWKTQLALRRLS